ncbi:MAG: hypothetical protein JW782_04815 [Candidatus Saganbacteria bacterium]|nr:hypothetical protein [Candidatus Saganbacteria bacterium]
MDVNSICSQRGVEIRPLPEGESLPEEARVTGEQIQVMEDINWLITSLQAYVEIHAEIRGILGQPGEAGSLRDHTWQIWSEVTQELVETTGVVAGVLPIERIAQEVIDRLEAEHSTANAGDLIKLREVVQLVEGFLEDFNELLTSGNYPYAAMTSYVADRSFKHNAQVMLQRLNTPISDEAQTGFLSQALINQIGLDQIDWADISTSLLDLISSRIRSLTQSYCEIYAAAIPEPAAPPIVTPPVTPAEIRRLDYGASLEPLHAFQLDGDESAQILSGPALRGQLALRYNFSEAMGLQLAYMAMLGVESFSDFSSDVSYDAGYVNFFWNALNIQGAYLWQRDFHGQSGQQFHFGSLAAGYTLLDGYVEPFVGGIFGGNPDGLGGGGLIGVRSSHDYQVADGDIGRISYTAQILASLYYNESLNVRPGGDLAFVWRPFDFGGGSFEVGARVTGLYNLEPGAANIVTALTLGWNSSNVATPYPVLLY